MVNGFVFNTIGLMGRIRSDESTQSLREIMKLLEHHDLKYCIEKETATLFSDLTCSIYERNEIAKHVDVMIVVGGDGSMLHAAHIAVEHHVPLIGVNRGRLGYLTDIAPFELEEKLLDILKGEFISEPRFLLEVAIYDLKKQARTKEAALNEVVLLPGEYAQMIEFEIFIQQQFVCRQRADGHIISTPTGSTAYALSGGGPILSPGLEAMVLVPMFSHTLSSRPIVIDSHSEVEIRIPTNNKRSPFISCDGMKRHPIHPGETLLVRRKNKMLILLHPNGYDYFETLRSKLNWYNNL
jgi:NAD+ kinase